MEDIQLLVYNDYYVRKCVTKVPGLGAFGSKNSKAVPIFKRVWHIFLLGINHNTLADISIVIITEQTI